jgi:hypothetical protein
MPTGRTRRRITKLMGTATSCRQTQGVSCRQTGACQVVAVARVADVERQADLVLVRVAVPAPPRGTRRYPGYSGGTQGYSGVPRVSQRGTQGYSGVLRGTERHANNSCTAVAGHVGTRARVASARVRDQNAELLDGRVGGVEHLKARPEALMRFEPRPARACRIARSWAGMAVACVLVCLLCLFACLAVRSEPRGRNRRATLCAACATVT